MVVVVAGATLMTKFIVENSSSIFKTVYHIVFKEKYKNPEYARLVHHGHKCL